MKKNWVISKFVSARNGRGPMLPGHDMNNTRHSTFF